MLTVAPLIVAAIQAGDEAALMWSNSVLGEVANLMERAGIALLIYILWLSLGPRLLLLAQIQRRKLLPIALIFTLYLLDALIATAHNAARDAELLMTGGADSSIAVTFTMADDSPPLPVSDLLLVTMRNDHYFVVARQPLPPSPRPVAFAVPNIAVDAVRMERVNPAPPAIDPDLVFLLGTPPTP